MNRQARSLRVGPTAERNTYAPEPRHDPRDEHESQGVRREAARTARGARTAATAPALPQDREPAGSIEGGRLGDRWAGRPARRKIADGSHSDGEPARFAVTRPPRCPGPVHPN